MLRTNVYVGFLGAKMATEATHNTKSQAKRSFNLGILSWGILSLVSIIGFLMERFAYGNWDKTIVFRVLLLLVIVLFGNFILSLRGLVLGLTVIRNRKESNDHTIIIMKAAMIGAALGITGAVVSCFLFLFS